MTKKTPGKIAKASSATAASKTIKKAKHCDPKQWKAPNYKQTQGGKVTRSITQPTNQKNFFNSIKHIEKLGFATRAIHAGCEPDVLTGAVNPAIELSTTFAQPQPG